MSSLKARVPQHMLKIIYQTTVQPVIDYCIILWGYTASTQVNKVQRFQHRAARIVSGVRDWNVSGFSIVNALGWMTAIQLRNYFTGVLMHGCICGNAPDYIKDSILSVFDVHNVYIRSFCSGDLYVPRPNREIFKQSFLHNGPLVWNS